MGADDDGTVPMTYPGLESLIITCSCLSVVGTLVMMSLACFLPRLRSHPARLMLYLLLSNFVWFGSVLVGMLDVDSVSDPVCNYVGPANQFFALTSIGWTCVVAVHFRLVLKSGDPDRLRKSEWRWHALIWGVPLLLVIIGEIGLPGVATYARSQQGAVCEVDKAHLAVRVITLSGPSIIGLLINTAAYIWAMCAARRGVRRNLSTDAHDISAQTARRLVSSAFRYMLVYVLCWFPSVYQDIHTLINDDTSPALWFIYGGNALFFLQGFFNSCMYLVGKMHIIREWGRDKPRTNSLSVGLMAEEGRGQRPGERLRSPRDSRKDSVYDSEFYRGYGDGGGGRDSVPSSPGSDSSGPLAGSAASRRAGAAHGGRRLSVGEGSGSPAAAARGSDRRRTTSAIDTGPSSAPTWLRNMRAPQAGSDDRASPFTIDSTGTPQGSLYASSVHNRF